MGFIPSKNAIARPIAGYQATNPIREKEIASGRLRIKYNNTNTRETMRWRIIGRRESVVEL
jgi:hypothetical protein